MNDFRVGSLMDAKAGVYVSGNKKSPRTSRLGDSKICLSLCFLSVLGVSVVSFFLRKFTTEAQSSQRLHREKQSLNFLAGLFFLSRFVVRFGKVFLRRFLTQHHADIVSLTIIG